MDPKAHLPGGLRVREAVAGARQWWDRTGRHLIGAPDWRNADLGVPSGIMRGLAWDELSGAEKVRVVKVWHREVWLAQAMPQDAGRRIVARRGAV